MADGGRERVRRSDLPFGLAGLYALLLSGCAAMALDVGPEKSTAMQAGFGIAAVAFVIAIVITLPIGVYIESDGVLIRNALSRRHLAWEEIDRFELGRWRGWRTYRCGVALLAAGGQVTIFALNPPYRGEREILPLIDDLNGRLGRATGRSFPPATVY
jgi:hypothetical protein